MWAKQLRKIHSYQRLEDRLENIESQIKSRKKSAERHNNIPVGISKLESQRSKILMELRR